MMLVLQAIIQLYRQIAFLSSLNAYCVVANLSKHSASVHALIL